MKLLKHLFVCLVLFFVLPALAYSGSKSPFDIKMPYKNLAIEYTHSGMTTGTEQYYIRKYGKETASYKKITTTVMGMKTVEETVEIQDPDWIYRFDLREKTGQKTVNPMK
ncbi:MAG: hypothetical protein GY705_16505, partial [Bacteroidetes bacterium]|nr:hypothetical protein [Bacteroidota bacterium]